MDLSNNCLSGKFGNDLMRFFFFLTCSSIYTFIYILRASDSITLVGRLFKFKQTESEQESISARSQLEVNGISKQYLEREPVVMSVAIAPKAFFV